MTSGGGKIGCGEPREDLGVGRGADFFEERIQSLGNFRFKGYEGPGPELGAIALFYKV